MNALRYVSAFAIVLALLGGLVLREGSRDQSHPPGDFENRDGVAVHRETRASYPGSDTGSMVSERVTSDKELHQLDTRIARLETQIGRLEQRSRVLENQQQALAEQWERLSENGRPQDVTSGNDRIGDDAADAADEDAIASERASVQERIAALESELTSESTDPLWSREAAERIIEVFGSNALQGNSLLDVVCATTLCRLEVMQSDEDSGDRLMDEIFPALGWQTHSYTDTVDHHDGSSTRVLYLSRHGYSLPPS